jgi:hypothetical protein
MLTSRLINPKKSLKTEISKKTTEFRKKVKKSETSSK